MVYERTGGSWRKLGWWRKPLGEPRQGNTPKNRWIIKIENVARHVAKTIQVNITPALPSLGMLIASLARQLRLANLISFDCFAWRLPLEIIGLLTFSPSFPRIFYLGCFVQALSFRNYRLAMFTLDVWLGRFRLGYLPRELSLDNFPLVIFACDLSLGNFRLGHLPW